MHCLVFEVKSIQSFIFASGRLRDAIGGSELIDLLTNAEQPNDNLLDAVLRATDTAQSIEFSRRAGGAFYAFAKDGTALDRFAALWSLALQHEAPGLGFVFGRGEGKDLPEAFGKARNDARSQTHRERAQHPLPAPVAERARRTGRVAVSRDGKDGAIDAATKRNKTFADLSHAGFIDRNSPEEAQLTWRDWPRNLESDAQEEGAFPFASGARDLALIHADGNGMGQVLIRIAEAVRNQPEEFLNIYQTLSKAIDASTQAGAQQAVREVLLPARQKGELLAARPILLGGDDVIVLVRADLALAYVQAFARAFEEQSRTSLEGLAKLGVEGLPEKLTIGFGLAIIGANQPFSMAVSLSESIMDQAKKQAKNVAKEGRLALSSVAFYRITSALLDDYDALVEREMTHHEGDQRYVHTLGTYALLEEAGSGLPRLSDLEGLVALLQAPDMARGPVRGLLNLLQLDPAQARTGWRRWRQRMRDTQPHRLAEFDDCLRALIPGYEPTQAELPYASTADDAKLHRSPLGDALDLLAVHHQSLEAIQKRPMQENAA